MSDRARQVSVSRVINAPPEAIFAVLADPAKHPIIDGSGTVKKAQAGDPDRLEMGSRFGMDMRIGLPYSIKNTVVEYEPDRLIAWQHFGHHRWRYRLEPVEGGTEVTETFDWSTARFPPAIELMGYPKKHPPAMAKTLERLDTYVTTGEAPTH
ncbi:MAG TPA: SRPBCC family protein [Acidimicrobiales bacterium]